MSKSSDAVKTWRHRTKELILTSMGNKCACCGYDKCKSALELHHIDPATKSFSFGGLRAHPRKWLLVEQELQKCVLVCANCHREIEAGLREAPTISPYDATKITLPIGTRERNTTVTKCEQCGTPFRPYSQTQKFCSDACYQHSPTVVKEHYRRSIAQRPKKSVR